MPLYAGAGRTSRPAILQFAVGAGTGRPGVWGARRLWTWSPAGRRPSRVGPAATIEGRDVPDPKAPCDDAPNHDAYREAQEAEAAGRYEEAVYHTREPCGTDTAPDACAARIRALAHEHGPFAYLGTLPYRDPTTAITEP